jgi:hypothetical protein
MTVNASAPVDPYRRHSDALTRAAEQEFSFDDVLDVINPLQHLPVIGWIYREISGDKMGAAASVAGGALFGGPLGFAGAILSAAFESISGEAPEDAIARMIGPGERTKSLAAYERASTLAPG